jgi:hypothetical protein
MSLSDHYGNPDGFGELVERIESANSITDWSHILSDYISFGNSKIAKHVGIFNLNAANDCPNKQTQENGESETGLCQVPWEMCYAGKAEHIYPNTLDYRRRQELLWDCLDADTFANAFIELVSRKRNDVTALRLSEAGDFRHNGDIYKAERTARLLEDAVIPVYTYSASYKLDGWSHTDALTVMESVTEAEYGDANYTAFDTSEGKPDGFVWCPHDLQKESGDDEPIKCGDCRLCIDGEVDVAIPIH